MKLAIAQINCVLGDLEGNVAKILQYTEQAKQQGAQLLLTPELCLCGYPPEDLLLRDGFYDACAQALDDLAAKISNIGRGGWASARTGRETLQRCFAAAGWGDCRDLPQT